MAERGTVKWRWPVFVSGCLLAAGGCESTEPPRAVEVVVGLPAPVMLVGASQQATALVLDQRGEAMDLPLTWRISPAGPASVSAAGQVTGLAAGETTLTASTGDLSGGGLLTVVDSFRLGLSLTVGGGEDPAAPLWLCVYSVRLEANGGLPGDEARIVGLSLFAERQSGLVDTLSLPPRLIDPPELAAGSSKAFLVTEKSPITDRTVRITITADYVRGGADGTLDTSEICS